MWHVYASVLFSLPIQQFDVNLLDRVPAAKVCICSGENMLELTLKFNLLRSMKTDTLHFFYSDGKTEYSCPPDFLFVSKHCTDFLVLGILFGLGYKDFIQQLDDYEYLVADLVGSKTRVMVHRACTS
jgi:hypothetical protein